MEKITKTKKAGILFLYFQNMKKILLILLKKFNKNINKIFWNQPKNKWLKISKKKKNKNKKDQ